MTTALQTIAVIGGGPAGSVLAERLCAGNGAGNGQPPRVLIFEEKRGWEKPCGGGLTWKVLHHYPFLADAASGGNIVRRMEVSVAGGRTICFPLRKPVAIFSRRRLNALLLERAEHAGAEVVEDRITRLNPSARGWKLQGRGGTYAADFVAVAAGARTRLRGGLAGDFPSRDFMLTFGYYVPREESLLRVECFRDFDGYAWSFPRPGHLSVGICGKVSESSMPQLKQMLHGFMARHGYAGDGAPVFAHLLPSLSLESWSELKLAGPGWALAGDAAGLVDPITGEGIYFAMRSGELLAESLLESLASGDEAGLAAAGYEQKVRAEFANTLMRGARASPYFYHTKFLGDAITIRMVQLVQRSDEFMNLLQDMIDGSQTYVGLKRRVYHALPRAAWQMVRSALGGRNSGRHAP